VLNAWSVRKNRVLRCLRLHGLVLERLLQLRLFQILFKQLLVFGRLLEMLLLPDICVSLPISSLVYLPISLALSVL